MSKAVRLLNSVPSAQNISNFLIKREGGGGDPGKIMSTTLSGPGLGPQGQAHGGFLLKFCFLKDMFMM